MTKFYASVLLAVALLMAACGGFGATGLSIAYAGNEASMEEKHGIVINDVVSDAVAHRFVIANYEMDPKNGLMSIENTAKADGNLRVQFVLQGEKGTGKDAPVKVGEYPTRPGNAGASYNSVISARISHASGGKEEDELFSAVDIKPGKVTITSVEGDTVRGEVDLTDGKHTINGSFTAKMLAK